MEERIEVDGLALAAHVARPATNAAVPAVILCHDFPTPPRGSLASGLTFPELADRIARDVGWMVFTFNFRGTGGSEGDFSVGGWLAPFVSSWRRAYLKPAARAIVLAPRATRLPAAGEATPARVC